MNGILARGDKVTVEDSTTVCIIDEPLGFGGQGEVYRATLDGEALAVKWYYPETATAEQREILRDLIRRGAPDGRFLWPRAMVGAQGKPGFGYLMALRDGRFGNINDLLTRRVTSSFRTLATAGVHLADGYFRLHGQGLCYRDISSNNVFLDPASGEILICDNDNVGPVGSPTSIGGTMRFMAPEVVRSEVPPNANTDLYSLSVLLFILLMTHHPLEGKREASIHCFDENAMRHLFGTEPLFIWDPDNTDNRPVADYQRNAEIFWPLYPKYLQDLFIKAFTNGLRNPSARVTEGQWRNAMSTLRDSIFYCGNCGRQNFYDVEKVKAAGGNPGPCWGCRQPLRLPPRIRIGRKTVMLNHDAQLFNHHIDDNARHEYVTPVAGVTQHPADPSKWGLTNLSDKHWTMVGASSEMRKVDPGRSVSLLAGTRILFGPTESEIRL